jgi:hypothetical protein
MPSSWNGQTPFEQIQSGRGPIGLAYQRVEITAQYNPAGLEAAAAVYHSPEDTSAYNAAYKEAENKALGNLSTERRTELYQQSAVADLSGLGLIQVERRHRTPEEIEKQRRYLETEKGMKPWTAEVGEREAWGDLSTWEGRKYYTEEDLLYENYITLTCKGRTLGLEKIYGLEENAVWGKSFDFIPSTAKGNVLVMAPQGTRAVMKELGISQPFALEKDGNQYVISGTGGTDSITVQKIDPFGYSLGSKQQMPIKDFVSVSAGYNITPETQYSYSLDSKGISVDISGLSAVQPGTLLSGGATLLSNDVVAGGSMFDRIVVPEGATAQQGVELASKAARNAKVTYWLGKNAQMLYDTTGIKLDGFTYPDRPQTWKIGDTEYGTIKTTLGYDIPATPFNVFMTESLFGNVVTGIENLVGAKTYQTPGWGSTTISVGDYTFQTPGWGRDVTISPFGLAGELPVHTARYFTGVGDIIVKDIAAASYLTIYGGPILVRHYGESVGPFVQNQLERIGSAWDVSTGKFKVGADDGRFYSIYEKPELFQGGKGSLFGIPTFEKEFKVAAPSNPLTEDEKLYYGSGLLASGENLLRLPIDTALFLGQYGEYKLATQGKITSSGGVDRRTSYEMNGYSVTKTTERWRNGHLGTTSRTTQFKPDIGWGETIEGRLDYSWQQSGYARPDQIDWLTWRTMAELKPVAVPFSRAAMVPVNIFRAGVEEAAYTGGIQLIYGTTWAGLYGVSSGNYPDIGSALEAHFENPDTWGNAAMAGAAGFGYGVLYRTGQYAWGAAKPVVGELPGKAVSKASSVYGDFTKTPGAIVEAAFSAPKDIRTSLWIAKYKVRYAAGGTAGVAGMPLLGKASAVVSSGYGAQTATLSQTKTVMESFSRAGLKFGSPATTVRVRERVRLYPQSKEDVSYEPLRYPAMQETGLREMEFTMPRQNIDLGIRTREGILLGTREGIRTGERTGQRLETREGIRLDVAEAIRLNTREGIREGERLGIRASTREGVRQSVRAGVRLGVRTGVRTKVPTDLRIALPTAFIDKPRKKVELKPYKGKTRGYSPSVAGMDLGVTEKNLKRVFNAVEIRGMPAKRSITAPIASFYSMKPGKMKAVTGGRSVFGKFTVPSTQAKVAKQQKKQGAADRKAMRSLMVMRPTRLKRMGLF